MYESSSTEEELTGPTAIELSDTLNDDQIARFRQTLMHWYGLHARTLPWRSVNDPYRIWVSETMLQQTRVAAVIEHYREFLKQFPSLMALALASEEQVLAAWSGLGYYRRARMLHKAAQFLVEERSGVFPQTAVDLRTLPGIGEYTSAAIASIAFGESIAAVDGNVERVLLRITGRAEEPTAQGRAFLRTLAARLVPERSLQAPRSRAASEENASGASAAKPRGGRRSKVNAAGDHNQAMMELGATICMPRGPLCLQCPVFDLCRTRGEHATAPRAKMRSREIAYLLSLRKRGVMTQVLLAQRPAEASLMASMYELPPLPLDAADDVMVEREPVLRVRHAITNTNYYVRVYSPRGPGDKALRRSVPIAKEDLHWVQTSRLGTLPLTGLARKILQRLDVMQMLPLRGADIETESTPVKSRSAKKTATAVVDHDEDHDSF